MSLALLVTGLFVFDHRADGALAVRGVEAPATAGTASVIAESTVIYANFDGGRIYPGTSDSALDRSSLVDGERDLPAADIDADGKAAVVGCLAAMFEPFGVTVTTEPPAAGVRHVEAMFGGDADDIIDDIDDDVTIAGMAPFRADCSVIEDAIVFIFTDELDDDYREICETAAQEVGHAYGLDHQLLASDPMTYLDFDGERRFRDETAACGERDPRPCGLVDHGYPACRADQNTAGLLHQRLVGDGQPPVDPGDTGMPPGDDYFAGGCNAGGSKLANLLVGIALLCLIRRR